MANILDQLEQLRADRDAKKAAWDLENERTIREAKARVDSAQLEVDEAEEQMRRTTASRQAFAEVRAATVGVEERPAASTSCIDGIHDRDEDKAANRDSHQDKAEGYYSDDFEDGSDEERPNQ